MEMFGEWIEIIFALAVMTGIVISLVAWSIKNGISPMPTSFKAKSALLALLPSDLQGKIYELGSGWGTLMLPLARHYPRNMIIGFETSPLPYGFSLIWLKIIPLKNVKIMRQDFFSADLKEASLVVCYLYPGAMKKLKDKFQKELKPGTFVISNTFSITGWKVERLIEVGDLYHSKIYLYKI